MIGTVDVDSLTFDLSQWEAWDDADESGAGMVVWYLPLAFGNGKKNNAGLFWYSAAVLA